MLNTDNVRLGVIGLGYVGLPLAVEFGKVLPTVGFDINTKRINELRDGVDHTLEVEPDLLAEATQLSFASDLDVLRGCNVYIVTVPTPIDASRRPDLTPLIKASETLGKVVGQGDGWRWDGVRFRILHPAEPVNAKGNQASRVLKVVADGGSVLLPGDLEAAGEARLVSRSPGLASDVLAAPHHGSNTSSTSPFIEAVAPSWAVFSVGYRNRWGFPAPEVVAPAPAT